MFRSLIVCCLALFVTRAGVANEVLEADLLVVGGTEAGVAAAVQAARCGVRRIVLVSDIDMLGGQFCAEGVGAIDEWTTYKAKRVEFPRSGTFSEIIDRVHAWNGKRFGFIRPGNGFCSSETIEPAGAARIFEDWINPYNEANSGQIEIRRSLRPTAVQLEKGAIRRVVFESRDGQSSGCEVQARLTIDATDWGDVIRLSGAKYAAGPDLRSRFDEPNAPDGPLGIDRNEMNPISYCLVLRETSRDATIDQPAGYDERTYLGTSNATTADFKQLGWPPKAQQMDVPAFVATSYPEGVYSAQVSIYTHRRLVDAKHLQLGENKETILVNWPTQDYPLYDYPQRVVDHLEATEKGASLKNIVDMTYAQRQIVFDDAKLHALGMLYHLQTAVQKKLDPKQIDFRRLELVSDFGTPDHLPPKPYVREGLRLESLYMLREGDLRMQRDEPRWARHMAADSVFAFQFNIDFHPTRRVFLKDDRSQPWVNVHTANRNWSTHTDRACFPLRSLIPVEINGLLGASKNLGVSSIVSSAVRLHGQMMLSGQAAGTVAAHCLREEIQPRALAADPKQIRALQLALVRGVEGKPGVLLWPYQDLRADDLHFEAANMLAVLGVYRVEDDVDFAPFAPVSRADLAVALTRARRLLAKAPDWAAAETTSFPDVPKSDSRAANIESLRAWGAKLNAAEPFAPNQTADWKTLHSWMAALGMNPSGGLSARGGLPLTRAELVQHVWLAIRGRIEDAPLPDGFLQPGHDADGDGREDREDPLPLDRNNNSLPDLLDPAPVPAAK
ncbi:FAD dependent oxidoreductase [Anatilimnocola aggregata]|uniref:FAD dependent oxidoreductase n=1 Tax=Anatilimnocola aggregata TaxID=2528021 RepID=A0A517YDX6_9BACT|nr:FAD-dependent oxidoreductase [Anatilimnocola aggregata]QDU28438.1 FAD dependent oxidoreductase [Anatilimnocola aggregata]